MKKLYTVFILLITLASARAQNLINDAGTINIAVGETIAVTGYFNNISASVNNGGVMEVGGNFTSQAGSIQFGNGIYRFNGSAPQILSLNSTAISSIELDNDSNLVLATDVDGVNKLNFINGKILSNGHTFTMNTVANSVSGADSSRFFVCNNNGVFKYAGIGGVDTAFYPIGTDTANYNPAWLVNSGTIDNISISVFADVLQQGLSGGSNTTNQHLVNRTWDIEEDVAGGTIAALTFQWSALHQRSSFNSQLPLRVARYNNAFSLWEALPNQLTAAGTNPYTVTQNYTQAMPELGAFIIADSNSPDISFVGIDENTVGNLTLYPNPINSGSTMQINAKGLGNRNVVLSLYNSAGQLVLAERKNVPAEGFLSTNLPNVSSGLYMLTITDGTSAIYKGKVLVK